ncbi:hypothetical protein N431DRAFT_37520 [Stipitochalara longipes BDJ]|nr:hypothetical protein N431DRAFT_37520 [Stipitochalara longipes BDJ]
MHVHALSTRHYSHSHSHFPTSASWRGKADWGLQTCPTILHRTIDREFLSVPVSPTLDRAASVTGYCVLLFIGIRLLLAENFGKPSKASEGVRVQTQSELCLN